MAFETLDNALLLIESKSMQSRKSDKNVFTPFLADSVQFLKSRKGVRFIDT